MGVALPKPLYRGSLKKHLGDLHTQRGLYNVPGSFVKLLYGGNFVTPLGALHKKRGLCKVPMGFVYIHAHFDLFPTDMGGYSEKPLYRGTLTKHLGNLHLQKGQSNCTEGIL